MRITKFWLTNYKSFLETESIELTPSFNIIVGQNNSGKTALLEALSLQFSSHPHRSIKTLPALNSSHDSTSKCRISFYLEPDQAVNILKSVNYFYVPIRVNESPEDAFKRFMKSISNEGILECIFHDGSCLTGFYENYEDEEAKHAIQVSFDRTFNHFVHQDKGSVTTIEFSRTYGSYLGASFRSEIYMFKAERLNVGKCSIGNNSILAGDASNLAEVLSLLQAKNPGRFKRYVEFVRRIFPHIKYITLASIGSNHNGNNLVQIYVWSHDLETERDDLAVPLSESGTGIGQVLAILYVVLNSDKPRIILIDEPQSFLHPGAVRKLFEILKQHSQHQFIITTHSSIAITDISPETILLVCRSEFESTIERIDVSKTRDLQLFLSEVGARLSDVFGSDEILWVEGRTEELCFPIIVKQFIQDRTPGIKIVGVQHTGDFDGRFSKTAFEIYERLSKGQGLLPPAIGFIFDQEGRTENQQQDLIRQSNGKVKFLSRRLYENYLLNPDAISTVFAQADLSLSPEDIAQWMKKNGQNKKYFPKQSKLPQALSEEWIKKVHAANLLHDVFDELSDSRVRFDKVKHGEALTEWILENSPSDFDELADLLRPLLEKKQIKAYS